jgi:hypothetical protein
MKQMELQISYNQFYIADSILEPLAPEEWTDEDVQNHHKTLDHIAALKTESDGSISLSIYRINEEINFKDIKVLFDVQTRIIVPNMKIGIYQWPFEIVTSISLPNKNCNIRYIGFRNNGSNANEIKYAVSIK